MAETTEQYRARINQLKTSIENEPLIKEMRSDIAEGISKTGNRQADIEVQFKDVIDNTTGKDVISAPEIIAARNGETSLKARLDKEQKETTAQLAHTNSEVAKKANSVDTMSNVEFNSWIATLLDGGPSIFMDTLSALNLAYPTGASGVALVRETDPAKIYAWNGTGWQLFGDYQGLEIKDDSVTTGKILDNNVTIDKTNFIAPSENLFNFSDIKLSGYYANDGSFILSDTFGSTGFIKVAGGKTYQTDIGLMNDYYGDVVFWQDKQTKLSSINSGTWNSTIATPPNTKYVTIPLRKSKDSEFGIFIEGSELPQSFIPYQGELSDKIKVKGSSLVDFSVGYDELEFIHVDENLFDKDNPIVGGYFNSNGTWESTELYNSSNFMKVKSGASYYADFPNFYDVCFFDEFKKPVKGVGIQTGNWMKIINVPESKKIKYMTIPYSSSYIEGDIQVRTGTAVPLNYMEFGPKNISFVNSKIDSDSFDSLSSDKPTKGKSMLVFGDSVSETATMNDDGTNYVEGGTGNNLSNWPTYAKEILETASMVNYAKSGARYKDTSTSDLRVKLSHQINTAITMGTTADIIVVSAGTNDGVESLGDFSTAMAKTTLESLDRLNLYEAVRWTFWTLRLNYPGAQFFAALPIQRADQETPKELIDCIVKMANRYNFYVIDANSESGIVRDFENISAEGRDLADGLHPNAKGKLKMGFLYARAILDKFNKF